MFVPVYDVVIKIMRLKEKYNDLEKEMLEWAEESFRVRAIAKMKMVSINLSFKDERKVGNR